MATPEQQAAIDATGNVLLMAGAGTGKTTTLVSRVLAWATRPVDPVPLDRVLMVTFTEAAAAEMRHRLHEKLAQLVESRPEDEHLAQQLARLETAAIGTIHGFCLRLIRDHFHELGLDPQLRVLDSPETRALSQQVLESVLEPLLTGEGTLNREVQTLIADLLGGSLPSARTLVRRLHGYVRSRHDADVWLTSESARWTAAGPETWVRELQDFLPGWTAAWMERLAALVGTNPKAAECHNELERLRVGAAATEWRTAAAGALKAVVDANSDAAWKALGHGAKTRYREPLLELFAEAGFLHGLLQVGPGGSDPMVEDWETVARHMRGLVGLTSRFGDAFARSKRELGVLDFADLEQFALRLLGDGTRPVAQECQARFDCVFIDEAQDLNPAQDAILRAVGRTGAGGNRFLVGDVKQSIYRFRLADPRIFQACARAWAAGGTDTDPGRVLPLTGNFRSHGQVLGFVNAVFSRLMHATVGGVDYDEAAKLLPGALENRPHVAPDGVPRVEIHLRLTQRPSASGEADAGAEEGDAEPDDATESEARLVARRLIELKCGGLEVAANKDGAKRPFEWRDAVVLLRSPGPRGGAFARVFGELGIPLATAPGPLFDQPEVRDLHCLLQILDNPLQDIPLAAVLRSRLAGIHDVHALAVIRMAARRERYWTALNRFHELGKDSAEPLDASTFDDGSPIVEPMEADPDGEAPLMELEPEPGGGAPALPSGAVFGHPATAGHARAAWPRVDLFLRRFAHWRRLAQRGSMATLVETILDDTRYEDLLHAGPGAAQGLANVRGFLELARRFDTAQRGGLLRFLGHLETQRESGVEAPVAAPGDAVSLMSVHASKGLEFPVVAVAGLGNRFNLQDLQAEVVLDEEYGLCPVVAAAGGIRYPSWPLWRAVPRQRRESLGEELRLLYVAFTRAGDRLILVGSASESAAAKWVASGDTLPSHVIEKASSSMSWLGPVFSQITGVGAWAPGVHGANEWVTWQAWGMAIESPAAVPSESDTPATANAPAEPGVRAEFFKYPHLAATHESAKLSVTALRRRAAEADLEAAEKFRGVDESFILSRPSDGGATRLTFNAAERGTLHHRFMEHVDLARADSQESLAAERDRLCAAGRFTPEESGALDMDALVRFWLSPMGMEVRARAEGVRREVPFTLRLTPADFRQLGLPHHPGLAGDEFVVVQGVIDIAVLAGDGSVWIGDFKTDRVTPETVADKVASYAPQLALYALALERIFGRKVTRRWLHFLAIGHTEHLQHLPGGEVHRQ